MAATCSSTVKTPSARPMLCGLAQGTGGPILSPSTLFRSTHVGMGCSVFARAPREESVGYGYSRRTPADVGICLRWQMATVFGMPHNPTRSTRENPMRSFLFVSLTIFASAGLPAADDTARLRAGATLMPTQVYSLEDDRKVLKAFEGLRVADVSDGMDFVGLHDLGLVN